jgi:hypothetical protein
MPLPLPADLNQLFDSNPDVVTVFSALQRISPELRPLALAGLPYGTRNWADTYGLIDGSDDKLELTAAGQMVAAAAAARKPKPYADVSLEDLGTRTQEAIDARRRDAGAEELETPTQLPVEEPSQLVLRLQHAGFALGQRLRRRRPGEAVTSSAAELHRH